MPLSKELYRYDEVQKLLSVSESTMRRLIEEQVLERRYVLSAPRITRKSIERFLETLRQETERRTDGPSRGSQRRPRARPRRRTRFPHSSLARRRSVGTTPVEATRFPRSSRRSPDSGLMLALA